ncbi:SIR2 family protein [Thomasclavelia spiroformis]|uniref:SIR2 family protein n=1 Tax=Thomasclavelia spiroformis TaxID=29348 RepID=UPI00255C0334|nr:SIR2 family protein [Thomasclavelia spiroformis]
MQIHEFVKNFKNHPIMFIGTGLSLRYLSNSYSWDELLKKIALDFEPNEEYYLDLKSEYMESNVCSFEKVATRLEIDFNNYLKNNRTGKFKYINDLFYLNMKKGVNISRFKLYIADLLKNTEIRANASLEISELKKACKNIGSIITTNYDCMIENIFSFNPLIGNDILLSNPYGAIYKIHGCVSVPDKIIITEKDYQEFEEKYELIRAQLLSLFIHNPIIFIGYNIGDKNIKDILKTIFSYVDYNSEDSKRIRDNFLLVEYDKGSTSIEVFEHDIDIEGFPTIRINKLKTDNFIALYQAISNLILPVSAMDIRKVQTVVREICSGGNIKVSITEDLDKLKNSDKVLVVGSKNTISYTFQTISEMMANYFQIIEESNSQLLSLINKQKIQSTQYFPIFGFSKICGNINNIEQLKQQQEYKIKSLLDRLPSSCKGLHKTPESVYIDPTISQTYKTHEIVNSIIKGNMTLDSVERYLKEFKEKHTTDYRKILCAYDLKKYSNI